MHSFCGSADTLAVALEVGLHISFAGMLTFKKNEPLRQLAKTVPLDRLLVETDSPYLAPLPFRGKRNEPSFVRHTAECLAEVHAKTLDEMAAITTDNARRLFGLTATHSAHPAS
jgi:TatD DNase family protein